MGKAHKKIEISLSFMRMLGIEIVRGSQERRFQVMAVVLFLFCVLSVALNAVYPLSLYYHGGEKGLFIWGHWGFTSYNACRSVLDNTLWKVYFPFIASAAYAHVLPDERKSGYAEQLIMKVGFGRYMAVKLCACGILGGIVGAVPVMSMIIISVIGIHFNPFLKDAVQYFEAEQQAEEFQLRWNGTVFAEDVSLMKILLLGMLCWFLLGMVFGLVAGFIGIWTENKLMIYMMPVVGLQLWDLCVYLQPLSSLKKAYIKDYMGFLNLGNLDGYQVFAGLLISLVCISVLFYPKMQNKYSEGGR